MGGMGSGRRSGWGKNTVSDMRRIDVRRWQREGILKAGIAGGWQWSSRGEVVASIKYAVEAGAVRLMYKSCDRGEKWQDMDYRVRLAWTPCNFGGARAWFLCPSCCRRVALLYGGKVFACRHCHRLAYDCQRETPDDRVSRQVDKLRERLKWEPGLLNGKEWKPKWMRWRTFHRLEGRYDEKMRRLLVLMRRRFGRDVDAYF